MTPENALTLLGHLDLVSSESGIAGWAWYPQQPGRRVELEILFGDTLAAVVTADLHRPDVADAGYGDGFCGFSLAMPYAMAAQPREVLVTVRDRQSKKILPQPLLFRQPAVGDALQKIAELEHDIRLLRATVAELERRGAADANAARDLFKTVGAFFNGLATSGVEAAASRSRTLGGAVADVTSGLAPFAFPLCPAPELSVMVEAGGTAASMHAALRELRGALGSAKAEILLLDPGTCEDAPLLPMVVQNLRYARLPAQSAALRCNDAMRLASGKAVLYLAAGALPNASIEPLAAKFEARPNTAAIALKLLGPDGESAGAELRFGEFLPRRTGLQNRAPVDAVAPQAFAIRRAAWERLGGLDEGFAAIGPALAEFCLRAKDAGNSVIYEPEFCATQAPDYAATLPDLAAEAEDAQRLREIIGSYRQAAE